MRSFVVAVAVLTCACGEVTKVPDAAVIDAYAPDSPAMITCGSGEMVCGGTCANVMTNDQFCGNCTTQCSPTQGCLSGSCIDKASKCSSIRVWDPAATDGVYFNPNTGMHMYCDFTNNMTYEGFGTGQYNVGYPNYSYMSSAQLNDPAIGKAFIGLYNAQKGLINLGPGWNTSNCCFKAADGGVNVMLHLGGAGHYVYPAKTDSDTIQCGGPYNDARYRFYDQSGYSPIPLPNDYFMTHPASVAAACGDATTGGNPGIFMRRRFGLN